MKKTISLLLITFILLSSLTTTVFASEDITIKLDNRKHSLYILWDAPPNAHHYDFFVKKWGGSQHGVSIVTEHNLCRRGYHIPHENFIIGQTYKVYVKAFDENGNGLGTGEYYFEPY